MRVSRPNRCSSLMATLLLMLGLVACRGGGGSNATPTVTQSTHPAGFISLHPGVAMASLSDCKTCHGQDLTGGISKTTCFTAACHHKTVPSWALPGTHGLRAKRASDASGGSFASCQMCHGAAFAGAGSVSACKSCHGVAAPHPAKPWHTTASNHATTDPSNAAVCAQCHYPGATANPLGHPVVSAPVGTAPGCYNNTLCHGDAQPPHAMGVLWKEATSSAFHGLEAKKDLTACQACHGTLGTPKFDGNPSTTTKCTTCHVQAKAHPTTWSAPSRVVFPGFVSSHRNALKMTTTCNVCHDFTKGRTAPDPAAPSCYSASANSVACHVNGPGTPNHVLPFMTAMHTGATQVTFVADCATCHAISGASPATAAPLCTACHQAGSPITQTNCTSCHSKPPVGTVFPDIAGVHAKHNALAAVTGVCGSCHQGSESGSQTHYTAADGRAGHNSLRVAPGSVAFLAEFSGAAGTATFNATDQTCSNVSCHGGVVTPSWATGGTINVATDCTKCHKLGTAQGVPENNSPFSGFHALHMNSTAGLQCTECHAMGNGTAGALAHFTTLKTGAMEGAASQTVAFAGGTYTAVALTCTVTCHGKVHAAYTWSGTGGVHPTGWRTSHPAGALTNLTNCKACHGTTLQGGPWKEPSCSTAACHHNTLPNYVLPGSHGVRAKQAQGATGGGLASCQVCHGSTFATPLTASDGTNKACTTCHGAAAPHPVKPWRSSAGSLLSHASTDISNAAICAQCHYPGAPANPLVTQP